MPTRGALARALRRALARRRSETTCSLLSKYVHEDYERTPTEVGAGLFLNSIEDRSDRMCLRALIEGHRLGYVCAWASVGGSMEHRDTSI